MKLIHKKVPARSERSGGDDALLSAPVYGGGGSEADGGGVSVAELPQHPLHPAAHAGEESNTSTTLSSRTAKPIRDLVPHMRNEVPALRYRCGGDDIVLDFFLSGRALVIHFGETGFPSKWVQTERALNDAIPDCVSRVPDLGLVPESPARSPLCANASAAMTSWG
jgi:hypothetical protein